MVCATHFNSPQTCYTLCKFNALEKLSDQGFVSFPLTDVFAKFAASAWGQKLAKRTVTAAATDFDRFKSAVAKTKRSRLVRKVFNQMKKSAA